MTTNTICERLMVLGCGIIIIQYTVRIYYSGVFSKCIKSINFIEKFCLVKKGRDEIINIKMKSILEFRNGKNAVGEGTRFVSSPIIYISSVLVFPYKINSKGVVIIIRYKFKTVTLRLKIKVVIIFFIPVVIPI